WPKHTAKTNERQQHGGNCSCLNNGKKSPAVQEPPKRRVGLPQVEIHAAGVRHHRREFAVAQGACNRQQSCKAPSDQQPTSTPNVAGHFRSNNENATPDPGADYEHRRIEKAQTARKFLRLLSWRLRER